MLKILLCKFYFNFFLRKLTYFIIFLKALIEMMLQIKLNVKQLKFSDFTGLLLKIMS